MFTVICVLKSGGIYDAEWVRKLHDACARNLAKPHAFACLSDVEVPCRRIALQHEWEGWWSKIELFKPGVIAGPTLYLDLDTAIVAPFDDICKLPHDFSMLNNFSNPGMVGSGVMWFSGENVPHHVYQKFSRQPDAYIAHHQRNAAGSYLGDQAFIHDCLDRDVPFLTDHYKGIYSYKHHCRARLPSDATIVCFPGVPKMNDLESGHWIYDHWK